MSRTVTVRIDDTTYKRIKTAAEAERRTISNFMEYATLSYVERAAFVDDDEMKGISENRELVQTLKESMADIKRGRYRIVR
jgi:predicted transcriptional regulator